MGGFFLNYYLALKDFLQDIVTLDIDCLSSAERIGKHILCVYNVYVIVCIRQS